jgi:hypothetical protein
LFESLLMLVFLLFLLHFLFDFAALFFWVFDFFKFFHELAFLIVLFAQKLCNLFEFVFVFFLEH